MLQATWCSQIPVVKYLYAPFVCSNCASPFQNPVPAPDPLICGVDNYIHLWPKQGNTIYKHIACVCVHVHVWLSRPPHLDERYLCKLVVKECFLSFSLLSKAKLRQFQIIPFKTDCLFLSLSLYLSNISLNRAENQLTRIYDFI